MASGNPMDDLFWEFEVVADTVFPETTTTTSTVATTTTEETTTTIPTTTILVTSTRTTHKIPPVLPPANKTGVSLLFGHVGFLESILVSVLVVLTIVLIFSAVYFYLIRKLGYFSDNPAYKRQIYYKSTKYQTVPTQAKGDRRPRPSTLCLTTTTSDNNFMASLAKKRQEMQTEKKPRKVIPVRQAAHAEPEASTVGSSVSVGRSLQSIRFPPSAHLPRKHMDMVDNMSTDLLITASSSGPSTAPSISDNSFVTARSVYFTPSQGEWMMDVPGYRSSRHAFYSGLIPGYVSPPNPSQPDPFTASRGRL